MQPPSPPDASVERSLQTIQRLKERFEEEKQAFSFPRFVDVGVNGSVSKTVDTTALYSAALMNRALTSNRDRSTIGQRYHMLPFGSDGGRRVHQYLQDLDEVLLELDALSCGDDGVKTKRRELVNEVVEEASVVEKWKDTICEMVSAQDV